MRLGQLLRARAREQIAAAESAAIMARIAVRAMVGKLKEAEEGAGIREQRLYVWCPLAEVLELDEFEFAVERLGGLPRAVFPLLRLCVLHRLRHRWQDRLSEEQKAGLQELIEKAEEDVKAHFVRFGELLEEAVQGEMEREG